MIKKLVNFAVDQRLVTFVAVLLVAAYGVYAYRQVPVEAFPDLDDVHVRLTIRANWPDSSRTCSAGRLNSPSLTCSMCSIPVMRTRQRK